MRFRHGERSGARPGGWFEHSVFVPHDTRRVLQARLDEHLELVRRVADAESSDTTSVHLGGSLARREPAVAAGPGPARLTSDLDLVVVGPRAEAQHLRDRLLEVLPAEAPDLVSTAFVVDIDDLPRLRGFLAHDLLPGWSSPVAGTAPAPPSTPAPTPADHVELLAHQLSGWLLHTAESSGAARPRHFRGTQDVHRLKALLEALRTLAASNGASPARYADLLEAPGIHERVTAEVPAERVRELVRAREVGAADRAELAHGSDVVRPALRAFLGAPDHGDASLTTALLDHARADPGVLPRFQVCLGLLYLARSAPGGTPARHAVGPALAEVLGGIDPAQLPSAAADRDRLVDSLGQPAGDRPLLAAPEHGWWLRVREDYYTALGRKNFGASDPQPADGGTLT